MYIEIEWFNSYSPGQGISFSVEKITVDTEQDYGDLSLITGGGASTVLPLQKGRSGKCFNHAESIFTSQGLVLLLLTNALTP